jgi:D-glycero-alpha-D-manno-heptose-7-phosphate kinase
MARRIEVRAPSRIDLAGGWTDVPIYCSKKSGEVVNIAINQYVRSEMVIDDHRRLSLSYSTDMPTGSGLGTSGAMNVGFITTIMGSAQDSIETAELAYQFEALLGNQGGRQDQWASALGGINHLTFNDESVTCETITPSDEFCSWLENNLLLFNSHITHVSGDLHKSVWQRFEAGDQEITKGLDLIRDAGLLMARGLRTESKSDVIDAMNLNSAGVDTLGRELHQPFREELAILTEQNKVSAWKAMGAGGGGVVGLIISSEDLRNEIIEQFNVKGWTNIPWKIDTDGVTRKEINL